MTCRAELKRSFTSYTAAFDYLTMRGFLCVPRGWENGRWRAVVAHTDAGIEVFVQLRAQ